MTKPQQYIKGWVEFYKQSLKNSQNIPMQYKKGYCEFYKLKFKVTSNVLIPRPETELLVDEVLEFVHSSWFKIVRSQALLMVHGKQKNATNYELITNNQLTILDIGTGSGAIAISIAKNICAYTSGVQAQIIASDVSEKALKVAQQNAKFHKVEDKITFLQSNLLDNLSSLPLIHNTNPVILIIVTNLPYIPSARIPYLDSSVKDFEPHVALDGGEDGFDLYRKLFQQIKDLSTSHRMCKPKLIIGEIDYTHGELAVLEAQKYFPKARVEVKKDLAHLQRILTISS